MRRLAAIVVALVALAAPVWAGAALEHDLLVRLQPATGEIMVTDTIVVAGGDELRLTLAPWLQVLAVAVDGKPAPLPDGPLALEFDKAGPHLVRIAYGGRWDGPAGEAATNGPMISAAGVFLPAGSGWLPRAGDAPASYRLSVEVPAGYRAVATGELVVETDDRAGHRTVWVDERPGEGPSLFAGPWDVTERVEEGVRYRTWFDADNAYLAELYLDRAIALTKHYAAAIGDYPYPGLHIVSAPLPVGLGFPGVLYVSRRILPLPFMQGRSLAHEVLHNWWGNAVAVEYAAGNWAEGLTTYMADHWLAEEQGEAEALRLAWLRDYRALPDARDTPVVAFTAKRHGADQVIGYDKAAFTFHMLRRELGDPAFEAGIRRFWRDRRFGVAGWTDLQQAFEIASGRDLDWFFNQWLKRPGAPSLRLEDVKVAERAAGFAVTVTVVQASEPPYRLSVPTVVTTKTGRHRDMLALDGPEGTTTVVVPDRPTEVAIDPDFHVFRRLTPDEAPPIIRDVILDPDAQVVLAAPDAADAARELAERLIDGPPRFVAADAVGAGPLLVIGTGAAIDGALADLGLSPAPDDLRDRGTARVWAGRRGDHQAYVIVAADDAAALRALIRPLPHYGQAGYLVFEDRSAVLHGVRPVADAPLVRQLGRAD